MEREAAGDEDPHFGVRMSFKAGGSARASEEELPRRSRDRGPLISVVPSGKEAEKARETAGRRVPSRRETAEATRTQAGCRRIPSLPGERPGCPLVAMGDSRNGARS